MVALGSLCYLLFVKKIRSSQRRYNRLYYPGTSSNERFESYKQASRRLPSLVHPHMRVLYRLGA